MGLKINKQTYTSGGAFDELYVRIGSFSGSKSGVVSKLQTFSDQATRNELTDQQLDMKVSQLVQDQIGESFNVPLIKKQTVMVDIPVLDGNGEPVLDDNDEPMTKPEKQVQITEMNQEIYSEPIYAFLYSKLKEHLQNKFGDVIEDC